MEMNSWHGGDALSAMRSNGDWRSLDSAINQEFIKSASSIRRGGITISSRTVARSSYHENSTLAIINELREDYIGGISHRSSRRRGSYSLPRDFGDQIFVLISFSRELVGQILGEVDSSMVAQIGDSGDRSIQGGQEDDNDSKILTNNVNSNENGFKRSSNDVEIVLNGFHSKPSEAKMDSPAYLLEDDGLFPLPADLMLHSTEKDKMQNMHVASKKVKQDRLPPRLDYISYMIHLAIF